MGMRYLISAHSSTRRHRLTCSCSFARHGGAHVRPAGENELAKRRMTSRLWSRRAAAQDASQPCLSAFGGKEFAMSPQWQTTASSIKRRAPGGTDTHEYCNVCGTRTPFCVSVHLPAWRSLTNDDGATNHSSGFATLGLYVVTIFSRVTRLHRRAFASRFSAQAGDVPYTHFTHSATASSCATHHRPSQAASLLRLYWSYTVFVAVAPRCTTGRAAAARAHSGPRAVGVATRSSSSR
jgi:hypothetical protein